MPNPLTEQINDKTFSVAEYLELVNELLGPLRVSIEGEITDLKILPQWVFFSLKDSESGEILKCGLHSGQYRKLGVNVEEGMAVKVFGYGKISPRTGNFGFWVSKIEPVGEGALRKAYELLVKKLDKEGLFTRKRELPEFISHIGVISSRNGVVVQDLMENLNPLGVKVDFLHSGVEGADSASEIESAIEHFSKTKDKPQVLVLIRGGGSMESLQGFNNENVVRAIFASPMPVLVGIGHDVDAPIATMVADWSASTPTAVAHVINDSWAPLTDRLPVLSQKLTETFRRRIEKTNTKVDATFQTIRHSITYIIGHFKEYIVSINAGFEKIRNKIHEQKTESKQYSKDITKYFEQLLLNTKRSVIETERLLAISDPNTILKRGFGLVYGPNGRLVRTLDDVKEGDTVKTRLNKGSFESEVTKKEY